MEKKKKQKLTILNQSGDYEQSLKILEKNGLRALTYQDALSRSKELIKAFKGKWKWFYLAGTGKELTETDGLYTFNSEGNLNPLSGKESADEKVRVWQGTTPLSLDVYSDGYAAQYGRRFVLNAVNEPDYVAPVVVGVKDNNS